MHKEPQLKHVAFLTLLGFTLLSIACQGNMTLKKLRGISVGGSVGGLRSDSVKLTLVPSSQAAQQQSVEIYPPGGPFHFRKTMKSGTEFRIDLETNPRYNSCVIRNSSSFQAIHDDIEDIDIKCSSVF